MDSPPRINFAGGGLTLIGLERILRLLDDHGTVLIENVAPGSVNLMQIGAALAWESLSDIDGHEYE